MAGKEREGKRPRYRIMRIEIILVPKITWKLHRNCCYLIHPMVFPLIIRYFVEYGSLKVLCRPVIASDDNVFIYLNTQKSLPFIRMLPKLTFIFIKYFWNTILSTGTWKGSFVLFFLKSNLILRVIKLENLFPK